MKYIAMIQARYDSSRLKGKVLLELQGKPVLLHVINRVKKSKYVDETIVLTSIEKSCLEIIELCAKNKTMVFVGSEEDVLDRYYQAAKLLKPQYIIRITADCPLIDWTIIDDAIQKMDVNTDYLGMLSETFADGLDVEIFTYSALETSWKNAKLNSEREHVTLYIKNHPELFKLQDYKSSIDRFGELRWTIDEEEDYKLIKKIYELLYRQGKETFNYKDVLKLMIEEPELMKINKKFKRNEGLAKSLKNDFLVY